MYAVVVEVKIESGREGEAIEYLRANVVPAVKQTPGLVSGYWLASKDGHGLSVLVFEDENAAQAMAAGLPNAPRAEFATLDKVKVREVVAHV